MVPRSERRLSASVHKLLRVGVAFGVGASFGCSDDAAPPTTGLMPPSSGSAGSAGAAVSAAAAGQGGQAGSMSQPAGTSGDAGQTGGAASGAGGEPSTGVVTNGILHPGIMTTPSVLTFIKAQVDAGREPWLGQLRRMQALVERPDRKLHNPARDNDVGGGALIYCGGYNRNATDTAKVLACDWPVADGIDAYTLALLAYLTGEPEYGLRALEYLEAWTNPKNFLGFDPAGSNAPLQHGWTVPWYANAAELLRYTYAGWKPEHSQAMAAFLDRMLPLVEKDNVGAPNNWLHSRIEAQFAAAIFLSDEAMLQNAIARFQTHTPSYVYIDADAGVPVMPKSSQIAQRGAAVWSTPKFVAGMTMETCRDLNHQELGMRSIFNSLAMAVSQGRDVFAGTDIRERLATFLEVMPVWTQSRQDHPDGICNAPVVLEPPSGYLRDKTARFPYEIGVALVSSPERPLLEAQRDLELGATTGASRWVTTWEALTHAASPVQ